MEVLRRIEKSYEERDKTESKTYVREYVRNFLEEEPIPGIEYELELYRRFIPGIAIEEINNLAKKWVTDHNRVVIVYAPEKEGLTIPTEDELLAVFSEIKSIEIEPYVDKVSDEPLVARPHHFGLGGDRLRCAALPPCGGGTRGFTPH